MEWFKHDSDATMDSKIKKVLMRYGVTGYAIYFHCLELIADSVSKDNLTFELEHDAEIIADDLRIQGNKDKSGREIVEEIMHYMIELNLFEESGGRIFCFKMLKRIDCSMTSNPKFRAMINDAKSNMASLPHHVTVMTPSCSNHDTIMQDKNRLEEIREDESILDTDAGSKTKRFVPPTVDEVKAYCLERNNNIDAQYFCDYYESKGWMIGKNKMKDWKCSVRTWERNNFNAGRSTTFVNNKRPALANQVTEEDINF